MGEPGSRIQFEEVPENTGSSDSNDSRWVVWDFTKSDPQKRKAVSSVSVSIPVSRNTWVCLRNLEQVILRLSLEDGSLEREEKQLEASLHYGLFESSKVLQSFLCTSSLTDPVLKKGNQLRELIDGYRVFLLRKSQPDLLETEEFLVWNDKVRVGIRSFLGIHKAG